MDDTVDLVRALVARDEAEVERRRAAGIRRFLRDADLSWLRPARWPLLVLLVSLASLGAAAAVPGGGIVAAARAVATAVAAAAILAVAVAGPALLLFLADLLADLRHALRR